MSQDTPKATGATSGADVDQLVGALLTASRALVAVSANSLAEVEDTLTVTQFRTLVVLDTQGQIKLTRLAELLDVNTSTAMRMVDRLVAAELVTRRGNPDNRREVLLDLSAAGRRIVARVTARRRREITRVVTAMPATQRGSLVRALRSFATAAGEPDATVTALGW